MRYKTFLSKCRECWILCLWRPLSGPLSFHKMVHYSDVIVSAMVSQITGVSIVYSTVCPGANQTKHQSYASLAFVRGIHRWPVNSPHKGPVTRKMFPFDFVIMFSFLPEASFGLRVLSLPASVCLCVCVRPCVNHELVRAITHHPFQLGSPNLDQRCKRPWLRSLLFCGMIDRDLQGQIELQSQNLPHFELVHTITHHQLKLQFPNLEQKCILALFRSLPILGLIEIDLQFNF